MTAYIFDKYKKRVAIDLYELRLMVKKLGVLHLEFDEFDGDVDIVDNKGNVVGYISERN